MYGFRDTYTVDWRTRYDLKAFCFVEYLQVNTALVTTTIRYFRQCSTLPGISVIHLLNVRLGPK